ncbi:MAG: carboxymuconolactone decarboxylase [Frankiales bacterium]|nr:carboxymuconolactone decarboxylase [Frankiales bacterium]
MSSDPPLAPGAILGWRLVPPVDPNNATVEQLAAISGFHAARGTEGRPLPDLFAVLFNAPEAAARLASVTAYCRFESSLSPLLREVALLASCYATGFEYEVRHHEPLVQAAGMSDRDLQALRAGEWGRLAVDVAMVAALSRAVALGTSIRGSQLEDEVRRNLSARQIVDVTVTAAQYKALQCAGAVLTSMADL